MIHMHHVFEEFILLIMGYMFYITTLLRRCSGAYEYTPFGIQSRCIIILLMVALCEVISL
jgi:hypothetical protein